MEINKTNIRFLRTDERKVLKGIRIDKRIGDKYMWAHLFYTRDITPDYVPQYIQEKTYLGVSYKHKIVFPQDEYDELVLNAVRTKYAEAEFSNTDIVTDSCIKHLHKLYGDYYKCSVTIYLTPNFNQIDPLLIPIGSNFVQFHISIALYAPCREFLKCFNDEGFFDNYDITDQERIDKLLKESLSTIHDIDELWTISAK